MSNQTTYRGQFFSGVGDVEYLELLDTARSMFEPHATLPNLSMLYTPRWNGFVEGPKWGAWWVQNSYGPTLAALPFYTEPWTTFLGNAQDLWFSQMGDGRRTLRYKHYEGQTYLWTPPDGCLCDAAAPDFYVPKQGDGQLDRHDWGMEFTAAGLLMQAELLLIARDPAAINAYLPKLERCAAFVESRRDPANNCFLAGPAGNLLAPNYAGRKAGPDSFGMSYLTGLSVTYCVGPRLSDSGGAGRCPAQREPIRAPHARRSTIGSAVTSPRRPSSLSSHRGR